MKTARNGICVGIRGNVDNFRELETQWNTALQTLHALEQDYAREQARALAPLSAVDHALIEQVVTDLPGVWHAPTTTPAERKRMVRCLIQDVSLDSFSLPGHTRLHLRWHTGAITTVTVHRPTSGDVHRLDQTLVAHIRALAQAQPDDRIAEILNRQEYTTRHGFPWTYRRVMDTRRRHAIPTACPITPRDDTPRGDGLVSVRMAVRQFHTSPSTILHGVRKGLLYSRHKPGVCPLWVRVTSGDMARLTRTTPLPQSLSLRQACQRWHLTVAQLWAGVKTGQYVGYRIRHKQRWEFRVTMP